MPDADPRPLLFRSFDQAVRVLQGVSDDQLTLPTPCSEFDVSALMTHMVGAAARVPSIGRGQEQSSELPFPEGFDGGQWSETLVGVRNDAMAVWADDAVLERKVPLPWGTFDGEFVARMYTVELSVHSWDLAKATGQLGTLDDDIAVASLAFAHAMLPPDYRGGDIPFAPVVTVPDDGPPYDRLVGYLGRSPA